MSELFSNGTRDGLTSSKTGMSAILLILAVAVLMWMVFKGLTFEVKWGIPKFHHRVRNESLL